MKWLLIFLLIICVSCGKKSDGTTKKSGDSPLPPAPVIADSRPVQEEPEVVTEEEIIEETEEEIEEEDEIIEVTQNTSPDQPFAHLEERGIRIELQSKFNNQPPVVICINTQTLNSEKILELKALSELVENEVVVAGIIKKEHFINLLETSIISLEVTQPGSRLCPKIFLAIGNEFPLN